MSTVKEIESALTQLPLEDLQSVRDWLDNFIEDQLDVSDEFKTKIQRAKQEIADGVLALYSGLACHPKLRARHQKPSVAQAMENNPALRADSGRRMEVRRVSLNTCTRCRSRRLRIEVER